jgi:glycerophosphoryl diester phosphodiesterase
LGHFPEHTIAGYTDAWLMGADYVELDLQMTRDGVLIANHDQCLKDSTDAILFDSIWQKRQKTMVFPNGNACTKDYLIPEFTLSELK